MAKSFMTTGEIARLTQQPEWRVRRVTDRLGGIEKFGTKRMIPADRLPEIVRALSSQPSKPRRNGDE